MSIGDTISPFERLRRTYESESRCVACGSEDDGRWTVRASGRSVRYERECRSCGARDSREVRLPR
ncbi:HVO_0649 family zinc finger protein [Halovivax limisalsi]|uniref:HVO_0649 family zinc finger protein n=1 Tax=Halovivax limisalsi TaxID=1453760 RepID=UPI001FFD51AB|nr:HVO_0649 family zinc finger protein [Halovivax limisalsi]